MPIHRCFVTRPNSSSTFRILHAPGYALRLLACDWCDLAELRAWLKCHEGSGAYVLSGLEGTRPVAYVGEGSRLWDRLPKHRSDAPFSLVQAIHCLASPDDFDKSAALFFQEHLSDRLKACGRVERIDAEPPRLGLPPGRLEELQRQLEPALALFGFAGCSAFVPARVAPVASEGDLA